MIILWFLMLAFPKKCAIINQYSTKRQVIPMNFWKSFSKESVLKQLFFVLALFAVLIPLAIWDSNTQVKITFNADSVFIKSDQYSLSVPYEIIDSAELTDLAEAGEKTEDGWDNDIIRTGKWTNSTWGEYYIVADLDASNCVVLHLNDGRVFVFNHKNNTATIKAFETLQTYLNK